MRFTACASLVRMRPLFSVFSVTLWLALCEPAYKITGENC